MYFINESGDTRYEIFERKVIIIIIINSIHIYTHNSREDTTIHIITKLLRRNE